VYLHFHPGGCHVKKLTVTEFGVGVECERAPRMTRR
jgi:hypothetical protein